MYETEKHSVIPDKIHLKAKLDGNVFTAFVDIKLLNLRDIQHVPI